MLVEKANNKKCNRVWTLQRMTTMFKKIFWNTEGKAASADQNPNGAVRGDIQNVLVWYELAVICNLDKVRLLQFET